MGTGRSLFESNPENRVCVADGPIIGESPGANRSLPPPVDYKVYFVHH